MSRPRLRPPGKPQAIAAVLAAVVAAVQARCTCTERAPGTPPLAGHEPDCSLYNTGWLD